MALSPTRLAFNPTTGQLDLVPQDPAQIVTVGKSGCMFTSIQTAINSITDASASKVYCILVAPGAYVGNVVLKPFIAIVGKSNGFAAPVISGKISGTFTNAGEYALLNRISQAYVLASDGDIALNVTGGLLVNDFFSDVSTSSNYGGTAIYINATTFPSTLYSGRTQVRSTFTGSTKNLTGVNMTGSQDMTFSTFQVEIQAVASSGTLIGRSIDGTGELSGFSNNIRVTNTAVFSGTAIGMQNTTASTKFRLEQGSQVRLKGLSGGTAIAFDLNSSGSSATSQYTGCAVFSDGFTNEFVCQTALGDTQNVWLNSANKTLSKTGAGLANVTPFDEVKSGFSAWSSTAGNFWSFTSSTGTFTNLKRFIGQVKSAPIAAAASQTLTGATAIPDLATSVIYADSTGVLKSTTAGSETLYEENVPMWEVWRDGSNFLMSRENHPFKFGTAVSNAWHNQFGSLLQRSSSSLGVGLAGAKCAFIGENIIGDHGITSTVAEAAAGFTATFLYVDGAGKMRWYATTDTFPAFYNNAGTPTLLTAGSNRWVVYRIGVIKDSGLTGTDTAQFVAVMDTVQNTSTGNATARITANTVAAFPPELVALEVCQVGFVVVRKTTAGAIDTTNVPPTTALQVFGAQFASGGTSTSSALIITNTTNFDTILSATDTNVQLALDTIDNTAAKKASSSTDNALVRFDSTGGQLLQNSGVIVDDSNNVTGVNDLTVGGNLTVNGTQTILNVSDIEIEDNNILINRGEVGPGVTLGGAGLEVERGSLPNDSIAWIESTQDWMTGPNGGMRTLAKRDMSCCSNYIRRTEFNTASGSIPAGWSGTATITTTRTLADLPRELTSGAAVSIAMTAGQIGTFAFTLDDVDLNRVLQAAADANVKSGTDILMTVKDGATTLGSVTLLSGFSTPRFDFVTASNAALTLNFSSAAGGTVVVSDCLVSAGKLVSGPQVGGWETRQNNWTTNIGNTSSVVFKSRNVGDSVEVSGYIALSGNGGASAIATITMPIDLTINTSKVPSTGGYASVAGIMNWYDASTGAIKNGTIEVVNATTLRFVVTDTELNRNSLDASDQIGIRFTVPVNELSVSAYYGHEGVEFAADDGSADVFGPNGALVPNVAGGTGVTTRTFTFPSSVQATDTFIVEYNLGSAGWGPAANFSPRIVGQSSYEFGIAAYWSGGLFRIDFGNGGLYPSNGLGAASGSVWSARFTAGDRFRVRKASSPSLAGHSVATTAQPTGLLKAGAMPGFLAGTDIPANYIGEQSGTVRTTTNTRRKSVSTTTVSGINNSNVTIATVTLNKGEYLIHAKAGQQKSNTATQALHLLYLYDGASVIYPAVGGVATSANMALGYITQTITTSLIITNDATVISLIGRWNVNETAGTDCSNELEAIRIA